MASIESPARSSTDPISTGDPVVPDNTRGGVILFSGGQDSTTCLLLAIEKYGAPRVWPVSFYYAQKHKVEVNQANIICSVLGVRSPELFNVDVLRALGGGALTSDALDVAKADEYKGTRYHTEHDLPSTVVPGRNLLFLTVAAAYAVNVGVYDLWTGGCLADYDGYPDCRPEFYGAAQLAIREALADNKFSIITPLVGVSKAQTFAMADRRGYLDLIVRYTHTCYMGTRHKHEWGYGCGECPACVTREQGWVEFKQAELDSL